MTTTFSFSLCDFEGNEIEFVVEAEITEGAPAARDEYGRPTEAETAAEILFDSAEVNGKERKIDDALASMFECYDYRTKSLRPMRAADLEAKIREEIAYQINFREEYSDILPF